MSSLVYLYALIDPRSFSVMYIGQSLDPEKRFREHLRESLGGGKSKKCAWIRDLNAQSLLPICQIMGSVFGSAFDEERNLILRFKARGKKLVNSTLGGEALSEESRKAIAAAASRYHKGRKKTEAQKAKTRAWALANHPVKGKKLPYHPRPNALGRKLSASQLEVLRRPKTEAHRRKLSAAATRRYALAD